MDILFLYPPHREFLQYSPLSCFLSLTSLSSISRFIGHFFGSAFSRSAGTWLAGSYFRPVNGGATAPLLVLRHNADIYTYIARRATLAHRFPRTSRAIQGYRDDRLTSPHSDCPCRGVLPDWVIDQLIPRGIRQASNIPPRLLCEHLYGIRIQMSLLLRLSNVPFLKGNIDFP